MFAAQSSDSDVISATNALQQQISELLNQVNASNINSWIYQARLQRLRELQTQLNNIRESENASSVTKSSPFTTLSPTDSSTHSTDSHTTSTQTSTTSDDTIIAVFE